MNLKYVVHSVSEDEAEVDAIVAGQSVRAKIPSLTVEMISEDGGMGHTFRFAGLASEDAAKFVAGAEVTAIFKVQ